MTEQLIFPDFKLHRDRARGEKIRGILEDEDVKATIRALEVEYWKQWVSTKPHEIAIREELYRHMCALGSVQAQLGKVARAGALSRRSIEDLEERARANAGGT